MFYLSHLGLQSTQSWFLFKMLGRIKYLFFHLCRYPIDLAPFVEKAIYCSLVSFWRCDFPWTNLQSTGCRSAQILYLHGLTTFKITHLLLNHESLTSTICIYYGLNLFWIPPLLVYSPVIGLGISGYKNSKLNAHPSLCRHTHVLVRVIKKLDDWLGLLVMWSK